MCLGAERQDDTPNTFAPEGASRCRALTSGLEGRAAGRKDESFRGLRALNPRKPQKSRKVPAKWRLREFSDGSTPLQKQAFLVPIGPCPPRNPIPVPSPTIST